MNPPTATAAARRRSSALDRRHSAARRRRRILVGLTGLVLLVVAVVALLPLARRAVNDLSLPLQYQGVIRQQAAEKRLDAALVAAVIYAETKFDARTSSAGAIGLMQLLPQTAEFLAQRSGAANFHTSDLWTPAVNIAYGSYYLRYLLDEYHDSTWQALAAYNGGESNVNRWIAAARARHRPFRIQDIPFPETRDYVERVLQARQAYRQTYAAQLGYD